MFEYRQMPFYMTNPMGTWVEAEKAIENEYRQMFSFFTKEIQLCWDVLEQKLEYMEYDGSPLYDEYPDKTWMQQMGIAVKKEHEEDLPALTEDQVYMLVVWAVFHRRAKRRRANLLR